MTVDEIVAQTEHAVIEVDEAGFILAVNERFTQLLGWGADLIGQPLMAIVPDHMEVAHHLGFSRFVVTGQPNLLESDVILPTLHASGHEMKLTHHIAAKHDEEGWRFVSMIRTVA